MNNIIIVKLDSTYAAVYSGIWQWDYGKILRIQGGNLPKVVEVHFSLQDKGGDSITRIGTTIDGATDVPIPDSFLENGGRAQDYKIYAFIYLENGTAGNTKYKIEMSVKSRPKPEVPGTPEEPELFRETVKAVNAAADRAEQSEQNAKASATEAGKYAASASESAVAAEKTKEDALKEVGEKKQEAIEAIQKQEETSVGKIVNHTDNEIQRIQNQTADSKAELEQTITNAGVSKGEIEHSIETAGTSKTALDKSTELAGTAKTELDSSTQKAGEAKTDLDGSVRTAGEMQETLSATVKQAGALDTSLGEKIKTGTQLKTDLTASGEKAVQDIQTAGSEQLGKMQAVAEEFTTDREQITTNKEDIDSLKEDLVDLPQFKKQNIASEINKSAIGYKNTTNINNNASFADGIYTLTTDADNTVFCGWYFAKKYEIEAGEYFIGFDYETNSGTVELEIRVDGTFKSIGNIKPIVDSETHTYVVKVSCTTGLGIEQIRISGKSKRITVHDIFITKVDNYTKVYSDINKYLKYHNKDFVTPESFGAIGNGIYDDTFAIKEAVAYCIENNVSLHGMREKVYCVSEQIDITNDKGFIIDFDWATIKAIANIDSILKFDGTGISDNSYNLNVIRNIKLDCANRTGGFYCPRAYKTSFIDFAILNVRTFGIKLDAGGGFNALNGAIIGQKTSNECVGIYSNTSDCTFTNVGGIDCHKGIYNAGTNFYYHCHFWLSGNCTGSLYFDHMSGFASLVGCCADTYERSYLSHTDYDIALTNCTFYINPNLYDSDVKPIVFNFRDEVIYYSHHITSSNCSYNIPTNSKNITANLVDRPNMKITFSGHNHFNNIEHVSYANTSEITLGTNIDANFESAKYKLMLNNNFAFLDLKLRTSAILKNWSEYEIATIDGKLYKIAEKMEFPCFLSTTERGGEQVLARLVIDGYKIIIITPTANMTSLIEQMKFITASAMYPLRDNA